MPIGIYKRKPLSEIHKKNIGLALKGKVPKFIPNNKGKKASDKAKKNLSIAHKGQIAWNKGKKMLPMLKQTKEKIREANIRLGIKPPTLKGKNSPNWKGGKIKIICKNCGKEKEVYPFTIKNKNGKFCSSRCSAIWQRKHQKNKDTSIEIAIKQELIKNKIPYMKQVPIEGIALVDFLLPNKIIIQCDGDYWHSRKINKGKDIAQDTILIFKGYKVFRFWEHEIKKSVKKCIRRIYGK